MCVYGYDCVVDFQVSIYIKRVQIKVSEVYKHSSKPVNLDWFEHQSELCSISNTSDNVFVNELKCSSLKLFAHLIYCQNRFNKNF